MNNFFYSGWIASKAKTVASVLPPSDVTTAIPSMNIVAQKGSGGSRINASGQRLTTRRRAHSRTKSTPATTSSATVVVANDDEQETSNVGEEEAKEAIKRVIRALVNKQ